MPAVAELIGQTFGRLTVLRQGPSTREGASVWLCRCECGTLKLIRSDSLTSGNTKSCGCQRKDVRPSHPFFVDLTGLVFNRLTVLERDCTPRKTKGAWWLCRCECGTVKAYRGNALRHGKVKSCGCWAHEEAAARKLIDFTGQRIGQLTVLHRGKTGPSRTANWLCRCTCGKTKTVSSRYLVTHRDTASCGCVLAQRVSARTLKDLTGQVFGKFTVLHRNGTGTGGNAAYACRCECGTVITIDSKGLRAGSPKSCGCHKNPNLVGHVFGNLTVLRQYEQPPGVQTCLCQCKCGNRREVSVAVLRRGRVKGCGRRHTAFQVAKRATAETPVIATSQLADADSPTKEARPLGFGMYQGRIFGALTVLGRDLQATHKNPKWLCVCACGKRTTVEQILLFSGKATSCGCQDPHPRLARRRLDLTGQVFGLLTVIERDAQCITGVKWVCQCECGNTISLYNSLLTEGMRKSCGCLAAAADAG